VTGIPTATVAVPLAVSLNGAIAGKIFKLLGTISAFPVFIFFQSLNYVVFIYNIIVFI